MSIRENSVRIGIDIGGTFTDLSVVRLKNMDIYETKVPSTPSNLLNGIREGLQEIMKFLDLKGEMVDGCFNLMFND